MGYAAFIKHQVLALAWLLAVAATLWTAMPARAAAFAMTFPSFPTTAALGTLFSFSLRVSIYPGEFLNIQVINLYIYKADNRAAYQATCGVLPLGTDNKRYTETETAGGRVDVFAAADDRWNYRLGYGYGPGPTSILYNVIWYMPTGWLAGPYQVESKLITNETTYSQTASFSVTPPTGPGTTHISPYVNGAGVFTQNLTVSSADSRARVSIGKGTKVLVRGQLLSEISILQMKVPPSPPASTIIIDRTYACMPEETTFDPPVTISITYDPAQIPSGIDEKNLFMAVWNKTTAGWDTLTFNVDTANHVVTAQISHFSIFSVLASTRPAAFTISDLSITPATVDTGKEVTISVTVTNTGDLSGTDNLTLKVDDVPTASKDVTVTGKSSQKVTFNASVGTAGTYTVDVNGLTGTFSVKAAPAPTSKPTPTPRPTPTPTPPSTAPPPSPTPTPTTLTPTSTPKPTSSPTPAPPTTPQPTPPPTPRPPGSAVNWWPIVTIILPIIALAAGIWLIVSSLRQK